MSTIYAKRYVAVLSCTHARGPHLSYSAAAKVLKKSKYFVQMWVERYWDTKTIYDLPGKGEKRATSSKEDKMIVALFKRNPTLRGSHGKPLDMGYGKYWSRLVQCTFFGRSVLSVTGSHETCLVSRWWAFPPANC